MMLLQGTKGKVADSLFGVGAVKFGAFKLKLHETQPDAPLSPIYLNLRTADHPKNPGPLTAELMSEIAQLFGELTLPSTTCYADIPEAGAPFGKAYNSSRATARRLLLFKEVHGDGTRSIIDRVEGDYDPSDSCLVIDDLITQAGSKLEAIRALEVNGLNVEHVLVLVDRQQGGREQLAREGYTLHSVFTLDELLDHYVVGGLITPEKALEVRRYIAANCV